MLFATCTPWKHHARPRGAGRGQEVLQALRPLRRGRKGPLSQQFFHRPALLCGALVRAARFQACRHEQGRLQRQGAFGSIPYLVVEYDGGQVKQCTFKHEDDVDRMIECIARYLPDIPLHSEKVERHLAEPGGREGPALRQEPDSGRRDDPRAA